jgi:hypothetical protein
MTSFQNYDAWLDSDNPYDKVPDETMIKFYIEGYDDEYEFATEEEAIDFAINSLQIPAEEVEIYAYQWERWGGEWY